MPTYEYRCPNGHRFELFQSFSEAQPTSCQECGASPVERVLFPVAVHFKGSGFYSTDYGSSRSKPAAKDSSTESGTKSSEGGGSDSASSSDSGGDSKPAVTKKAAEA